MTTKETISNKKEILKIIVRTGCKWDTWIEISRPWGYDRPGFTKAVSSNFKDLVSINMITGYRCRRSGVITLMCDDRTVLHLNNNLDTGLYNKALLYLTEEPRDD